jgi:hypothetical protein
MSATNPSTTKMIQNIFRCMPRLYAQFSFELPNPFLPFPVLIYTLS